MQLWQRTWSNPANKRAAWSHPTTAKRKENLRRHWGVIIYCWDFKLLDFRRENASHLLFSHTSVAWMINFLYDFLFLIFFNVLLLVVGVVYYWTLVRLHRLGSLGKLSSTKTMSVHWCILSKELLKESLCFCSKADWLQTVWKQRTIAERVCYQIPLPKKRLSQALWMSLTVLDSFTLNMLLCSVPGEPPAQSCCLSITCSPGMTCSASYIQRKTLGKSYIAPQRVLYIMPERDWAR